MRRIDIQAGEHYANRRVSYGIRRRYLVLDTRPVVEAHYGPADIHTEEGRTVSAWARLTDHGSGVLVLRVNDDGTERPDQRPHIIRLSQIAGTWEDETREAREYAERRRAQREAEARIAAERRREQGAAAGALVAALDALGISANAASVERMPGYYGIVVTPEAAHALAAKVLGIV